MVKEDFRCRCESDFGFGALLISTEITAEDKLSIALMSG